MSDLIDDPRLGENAPEFTVSEISGAVKRTSGDGIWPHQGERRSGARGSGALWPYVFRCQR